MRCSDAAGLLYASQLQPRVRPRQQLQAALTDLAQRSRMDLPEKEREIQEDVDLARNALA